MAHLLDHPALDEMDDAELRALEQFMRFCAEQALNAPDAVDIEAFTELTAASSAEVTLLAKALARFGAGPALLAALRETGLKVEHRTSFKGVNKGPNSEYRRSVSVPIEGLPNAWQSTLQRLKAERAFSDSILNRMERRLGMFVWSSCQDGLPPDLRSLAAQRALYRDMRARSADKNEAVPRWSYLRSTWEELRRFARAHNLPNDAIEELSNTYQVLVRLEAKQEPLKFSKIMTAGTTSSLLAEAEEFLAHAEAAKTPDKRWALRNRAAAIAIGCAIPARPGDVSKHHIFGAGITYDPARSVYRFCYVPGKTRCLRPDLLDISLQPYWNKFIDALILQDQDSRYLNALRAKAITDKRPLYVNYDRTPCASPWYSRAWVAAADTGGHIARTLINDEFSDMGEFGIQYAAAANHHFSEKIKAKYRSGNAVRKSYARAHDTMSERFKIDDDISDLI
ncbi:hypothetical protein [Sulfitobacter brevis]|nr:hypothetical protein [Sulfitobacter brevis]